MTLKCPTYKTPQQQIKQLTAENARLRAALDCANEVIANHAGDPSKAAYAKYREALAACKAMK